MQAPASRPILLNPQAAVDAGKAAGRGKVSDRVALLKKALAGETAAAHRHQPGAAGGACAGATTEDEDAVSALFQLSGSVC